MEKPEPKLPDLITLVVTPQDAVTINYLIYTGSQLTLALRPSGDDTRVQTEATTLDFLLNQISIQKKERQLSTIVDLIQRLTSLVPDLVNDVIPTPEP